MTKMKTATVYAKNSESGVHFLTVGYEIDMPDVGSVLRHITYDVEFFDLASISTVGFDPAKIKLLPGWTQSTKKAFDAALAAKADAKAAAQTQIESASAAYVAREKEKKQAVVDALLSLGTDNPALARLAQLYS